MRAAIYARMSTNKQSETSPDDQIAECRRAANALLREGVIGGRARGEAR